MNTSTNDLRQNVLDELEWEPSLDADRIGVALEKGVVVLTGHVRSLLDRHTAEEVVKRVRGVHAVANELAVDLLDDFRRDDVQIANAVEHALRWNVMLPADRFRVAVSKGWVTIEGEVPFAFQRRALQDTVEHIFGVRGLTNLVSVKPAAAPEDVRRRINTALHRYAQLEADGIQVDVSGRKVVLHGKVRSWAERDRVQTAAWSAPGVSEVDNHLEVGV